MQAEKSHITVNDVTMAYGDFVVMRDLTFTVYRGDVFVIMGGSGCGKSTLLRILIGLKSPTRGSVLYGDTKYQPVDRHSRDRRTYIA